ncbi:MAG: RHS repeat protein [Flavobacteriales bacterium]|nr:RHS repeat protein [Flavobacteriales bacterium]
MKRFYFFITCLVMSSIGLQAQIGGTGSTSYTLPKLIPPAPETASLLRFTETPVSYNTGVPNISIPIATLPGIDLSASVSVSYHSGGHRVTEESTWVGLGWNLSAGGQITRTVRSYPDDSQNGFINFGTTVADLKNICSTQGGTDSQGRNCVGLTGQNAMTSQFDYEPDDFNYSMLGLSGRFMFNQDRSINSKGEIIQFPDKKVVITPIYGTFNGYNQSIVAWDITDTAGNVYHFEMGNVFDKSQIFQSVNGVPELAQDDGSWSLPYVETWDLTSVTSPNGDVITFQYDVPTTFNEFSCGLGSDSVILRSGTQNPNTDPLIYPKHLTTYTTTQRKVTHLEKIISSQGSIELVRSTALRDDTQYDAYALQYVRVFDANNQLTQEVEFIQDYLISEPSDQSQFTASINSVPPVIDGGAQSFLNKRLRLREVRFNEVISGASTSEHYKYSFDYNETIELPHKRSFSQDHWGYYNGYDNATLIPKFKMVNGSQVVLNNLTQFGNREVNPSVSTASMLTKITFPEGGRTVFAYENNRGNARTKVNDPYISTKSQFSALLSNQHSTSPSGNQTLYLFENSFTIPADAKEDPDNEDKTLVQHYGFTNRCESGVALYDVADAVCNRIFLNIYKLNSFGVRDSNFSYRKPLWEDGSVLLDRGFTYEYEIEIAIENNDYNFAIHHSEVELTWLEKNPNPTETYFDYFGGARVKSIANYNESGLASLRQFEYEDGYILSEPSYYYISLNNTHQIASQSWIPLLTTQGAYVNYDLVREITGTGRPQLIDSNSDSNPREIAEVSNFDATLNPDLIGEPYEIVTQREYHHVTGTLNKPFEPTASEWTAGHVYKEEYGQKKTVYPGLKAFFDTSSVVEGFIISPKGFPNSSDSPYNLANEHRIRVCVDTGVCPIDTYELSPGQRLPSTPVTEIKEGNQTLITRDSTFYESIPHHYNPTKVISTTSEGRVIETRMKYAYEMNNTTLSNANRISMPLETTTIRENVVMQTIRSEYAVDGSNYLPKKVSTQKSQQVALGTNPTLEDRLVYHSYYANGKVREVSQKDGTRIVYLWGYEQGYPIAKIENATFADVDAAIATLPSAYNTLVKIQNLSNSDLTNTVDTFDSNGNKTYQGNEGSLREAFELLRAALPKAMITSITYDPLIGTTSMTDPRGNTVYYKYDGFNRLIEVKDWEGNILSENAYHYKN